MWSLRRDKESKLYVANQASLGGFSSTTTVNIETVQTPCVPTGCGNNPANQGYWASPAYWFDGSNGWIYYSPTAQMNSQGRALPGLRVEASTQRLFWPDFSDADDQHERVVLPIRPNAIGVLEW